MESSQGKWIQTMDDGILLFKNISFTVQEKIKEEKKEVEYEHNEANSILTFDDHKLQLNLYTKYFHQELGKNKTEDENQNLQKVTIRVDEDDKEIELDAEQAKVLQNRIEVTIRLLTKTGIKSTVKGFIMISENLRTSLANIFLCADHKIGNFKIFCGDKEMPKDATVESLCKGSGGIQLFACESLGKPFKWKRFTGNNGDSTWSNNGNYTDSVVYIPQKDVTLAGFSVWAPKDDPKYYMKYRVDVDGATIIEDQNPTEYNKFEEKYYNRVYFENTFDIRANQRIKFTCWISKNFANNEYVYTYYGTNGSDYANVPNDHMGLFTLDASDNSSNGTSVYSGHFPEIFYFL